MTDKTAREKAQTAIAENRKAFHDFHLLETFEAGLVLLGTEVKAIREGRVNLRDSYARVEDGEVFLYNVNNFLNVFTWRVIPTDGRPHHPVYSKDQTFMGDSVGRWEGDTLVVDVVGFNDVTWLGYPGWFHTSDMRVVERFRRDGNTLTWQVTVHDPAVLLEPWEAEPRVLRLNPSTVYTGNFWGGLFKSPDAGSSWSAHQSSCGSAQGGERGVMLLSPER